MNKYLKIPCTTKSVIDEIKKMCSDYINKETSEDEIKEYLVFWKENCGDIFYKDGDLNPTVKLRIGSKRTQIIEIILKN